MQGKEMERPKLEDQWSRKIQRENKKRAARAKNLQALGYEFNAPEVKKVAAAKAITAPGEEAPKAIEAPPAAETEAATPAKATPAKSGKRKAVDELKEEAQEDKATASPAKKRGRPAKTQTPTKKEETPKKTRKTKA